MATLARKSWLAGIAVLTAWFFTLLLMNDLAYADITATTGEVHEGPPPASVELNQHEHDDNTGTDSGAHAFNEEQDYVTKAPIALDVCTTATSAFVKDILRSGVPRDEVQILINAMTEHERQWWLRRRPEQMPSELKGQVK